MLKMDFLGLRTLTLVDNSVRLIKKTRGETVDIFKLPLDDMPTFQLLQRGDAKGVFQFESEGIRELLKRMKPDHIRDIIACTALYRPGPLEGGMVDEYIECKHGRKKPTYPHPFMEEVLSETYGVMCYQEQVMRILNKLGGIELSSAYACIKAISKKKEEIINARKIDFVRGAKVNGLEKENAGGDFQPDRQIRGLRVQQEPFSRVRSGFLPDRLFEATLSRRVHGGAVVVRNRRRQQARHARRSHCRRPQVRR